MKEDSPLTVIDPAFQEKVYATVPGMAHFASTGPVGARCSTCRFHRKIDRKMRCHKYSLMMKKTGGEVPGSTPACRYYDPNPAPESAFKY